MAALRPRAEVRLTPGVWNDWRALTLMSVVLFGVWGFLVKVGTNHLPWQQVVFTVWATNFLILVLAMVRHVGNLWTPWTAVAFVAGVFAAFGSLLFYRSMSLGPASLVVPLSSLYVLVTFVLAVAILQEPVHVRHLLGVGLGLASMLLLAR